MTHDTEINLFQAFEAVCEKAGCGSESDDPEGEGWHMPSGLRDRHDVNTMLLCQRCWSVCLSIGFTL